MAKPFKDLNRKPTKEELEKGMSDNLAELERIEKEEKEKEEKARKLKEEGKDQDEDQEEEQEDDENQDQDEDQEQEDDDDSGEEDEGDSDGNEDDQDEDDEEEEEEPVPPQAPKKTDAKPKEEKKDEPDYRKRYSDSSSEAHILYSKNKKMADAISKANDIPEPTEEELKAENPEWDVMSDTEKRLAKRSLHDSKKLQAITASAQEFKDIDAWNTKVDNFLIDPQTLIDHPQLDGKEEDFKAFVTTKQSRMGADLEDLVASFLHGESLKVKTKNKGAMFPHNSGGNRGKIEKKSDKISIADSKVLMKTNYKKYLQLLKEGKIEQELE